MAIQFRRGDYDDMDANALLEGEACITTQDDPNTADGRGFYIKNGTLKRVLTDGDLEEGTYTLLDTITVSENTSNVSLFTTSSNVKEYLIVVDGSVNATTGALMLKVDNTSILFSLNGVTVNKAGTIKRITTNEALVSTNQEAKDLNITNKTISLSSSAITIQSGTVIKIYAR